MSRVYHAHVITNALALSGQNGTPSVAIQMRTTHDTATGEVFETTMTGNLWLTQNAAESSMRTLSHVFGWQGDTLQELNMPVLVGIECEIVVEDETYNGRTYPKIQFFNRPGEGGARSVLPIDEAAARSVASRFDSALRAFKAKGGAAGKPASARTQHAYQGAESQHPTPPDDLPDGFN